jgi:hypothetical protein
MELRNQHKWIVDSNIPLLYLSGQSGVGKSSLLNAAIVPALASSGWVVVSVRPNDDPFGAISAGLLKPNVVWQKPPSGKVGDLRDLLERAADRTQKQEKRLLLVVDQFEEALILCNDTVKAHLAHLFANLLQRPIDGVVVILALRTEYLADLADLGLPAPNYGRNAFDVRAFTRAAAQAFIEASDLKPGAGLLDKVLQEAAEIEDMPDKVRPIVLNMFGLVIASFKGSLPKGVEPGRLLSGYVERSLNHSAVRGVAIEILRPLVTDVGTKRALPIDRIAQSAGIPRMVARGSLILVANDGLVRPLDKDGDQWEVAHDFVARLLQPIVRNWRKGVWESVRPWLAPATLSFWLVGAVATILVFPSLHDDFVLRDLRTAGLVPGPPNDQGSATFFQNGQRIESQQKFWRVVSRMSDLSYPVADLTIKTGYLLNLNGMPALPALTRLDLSSSVLTSLEGMPVFPALTQLHLSSEYLTNLQGMPALPALAQLLVEASKLTSLQGMPALPALTQLYLNCEKLTSLQGMPALPALTELYLTSEKLTNLQGMPALPALIRLVLNSTSLTSLQGMPALPALAYLDLRSGYLTSLQGMPALPELRLIEIEHLDLVGFDQLKFSPKLEKIVVRTRRIGASAVPEEFGRLVEYQQEGP